MKMNYLPALEARTRRRFTQWVVVGISLLSFAAGSLLTVSLMHVMQVRADSNRVFELRVYHTVPGKVPALESIFRDVSKLQDKYNVSAIGYWVPTDDRDWANTFIYLVAHPSREEAKKNWDTLHADPAFPELRKQAAPLIERANEGYRVDEVFMRPTDYSAMR